MTPTLIVSTQRLHLVNDGGAFDPERHPNLRQPTLNHAPLWWRIFWLRAVDTTDTNSRIHA